MVLLVSIAATACTKLNGAPRGGAGDAATADVGSIPVTNDGGPSAPCAPDQPCRPADPCHEGETICSATGVASCKDTQRVKSNGSGCDDGSVCKDGACVRCAAGTACAVEGKPCRTGTVTCTMGSAACVESDNQIDGMPCGNGGMVCQAGSCVACPEGGACTPANPCRAGALACGDGTGAAQCNDAAVNLPAGTSCGKDLVCTAAGTCGSCAAGSTCYAETNPCRMGITVCNTGVPICLETGNTPNGRACGTGKVCSGGACVACVPDLPCTPTNPCHAGQTVCAPDFQCVDTGTLIGNGMSCGKDRVCSNGNCTACVDGAACQPSDACKMGTTSCSSGVSSCVVTGNSMNGAPCGAGKVCMNGSCQACAPGQACAPANPCHRGTLSCDGASAVCTDGSTNQSDGTSCGANLVCRQGLCVACTAGAPCQPSNSCKTGTIVCATGSPVCTESGNRANGVRCSDETVGMVCNEGICITCTEGGACTPANACHGGRLSCGTGVPQCVDSGAMVSDGNTCGTNLYCKGGTCMACTPGLSCTTNSNPCKVGTTSCSTGASVCGDGASKAVGASCGTGKVCNASGACVPCVAGQACTPANRCHAGTTVCGSGAPVCMDTGTNAMDGTNCDPSGGATMFCRGGACGTCTPNQTCQPANPCKNGITACTTGSQVCMETTNKGAGATCGPASTCTGGVQTNAAACDASGTCLAPTTTTCSSTGCNAAGTACNPACTASQIACGSSCCGAGQGCCSNVCTALDTSSNCGGCGIACNAPPAASCTTSTTKRTYPAAGICTGAGCSYPATDAPCGAGEVCTGAGVCDCPNPCLQTGCGITAVDCHGGTVVCGCSSGQICCSSCPDVDLPGQCRLTRCPLLCPITSDPDAPACPLTGPFSLPKCPIALPGGIGSL